MYPVSDAEIKKASDYIWNELLDKYRSAQPVNLAKTLITYLLGGQPGAGKSTLEKDLLNNRFNNNALFISMDNYREYHPQFDEINAKYGAEASLYTHSFAGEIADMIMQKAIADRYNIVLEGTLKSYESVAKRIKTLKDNGYECNIAIVTCPAALSRFGIIERYDQKGKRYVKTDIHEETIKALPKTHQKIYDDFKNDINSFEIRGRNGILWNKDTDQYPSKAIENELNRSLTKEEILFIDRRSAAFFLESKAKVIGLLQDESNKLLNKSFVDKEAAELKTLIDRVIHSLGKELTPTIPTRGKDDGLGF
jgi:UDP-N-acetylglucosamine kinase